MFMLSPVPGQRCSCVHLSQVKDVHAFTCPRSKMFILSPVPGQRCSYFHLSEVSVIVVTCSVHLFTWTPDACCQVLAAVLHLGDVEVTVSTEDEDMCCIQSDTAGGYWSGQPVGCSNSAVRASDNQPRGPGFKSTCCCLETLTFIHPTLPVAFGRDTKSCWSLLPNVHARGSKRSHTWGKCVTYCGLNYRLPSLTSNNSLTISHTGYIHFSRARCSFMMLIELNQCGVYEIAQVLKQQQVD